MTHQPVGKRIVIGEERRHLRTERDARGTGQRGEIGDQIRLVLVGKRQRIGEDQAAFGIGIADLDGDALCATCRCRADGRRRRRSNSPPPESTRAAAL